MFFIALLVFITFATFFVIKIVKATKAQTNKNVLKNNTTKNRDETDPFVEEFVCGRDGFGILMDE